MTQIFETQLFECCCLLHSLNGKSNKKVLYFKVQIVMYVLGIKNSNNENHCHRVQIFTI